MCRQASRTPVEGDSDDQGLEHPMFKEGLTEEVCLVQKKKDRGGLSTLGEMMTGLKETFS